MRHLHPSGSLPSSEVPFGPECQLVQGLAPLCRENTKTQQTVSKHFVGHNTIRIL